MTQETGLGTRFTESETLEALMDDLDGRALDRLDQLELMVARDATTPEWLLRQLRRTLEVLAEIEPVADLEWERDEDF